MILTAFLKKSLTSKTLLIMKLTAILLLTAFLQVSARGYSQKVSLSVKNASLQSVFKEIERQAGYQFFYNENILQRAKTVSLDIRDSPVEYILQLCFLNQPLSYSIIQNTVVIKEKELTEKRKNGLTPQALITVQGIVTDEANNPLEGASVEVKGAKRGTFTDATGKFELKDVDANAILVIQFTGFTTQEINLSGQSYVTSKLSISVKSLTDVNVQVSTGYQTIPKERSTGSFTFIDNNVINRSVSTNILDRLEGVTSGVLFSGINPNNIYNISIRGLSTIFSDRRPLIVLDNFEYEGELDNINPNDVENITILKDGAAASIWGAKAGNGVIVITTKKGSYNKRTRVSFNSNITIAEKPNLFDSKQISIPDYINVEKFLFEKGYYNSRITSTSRPALSPVIEILLKQQQGQLSSADANSQIDILKNNDVRNDLLRYFYQNRINKQYAVNISGGSQFQKYYISLGWDKNLQEKKGEQFSRLTLNANNTYSLIGGKLEVTTGLIYSRSNNSDNISVSTGYPYSNLADINGNYLDIAKYRTGYIDTAGSGKLLDWRYKPLEELNLVDNETKQIDYKLNIATKYHLPAGFAIDLKYQYGNGTYETRQLYNQSSFFVRDLINTYSQVNFTTGAVTRPIPLGGIIDIDNSAYTSQHLRGQVNFLKNNNYKYQINIIAGAEISEVKTESKSSRIYGYDDEHATSIPVDFVTSFKTYITGATAKIPSRQSLKYLNDRFISLFANAGYTFRNRYTFSASVRKDASNIFGVEANQKWVPLWSVGGSWEIAKEPFAKINRLSHLRLRITYGFSGNVNKSITAFLTTRSSTINLYNQQSWIITNLPNPELRWERTGMLNIGVDYSTQNNRISGSIEYFQKRGLDLIGEAPLPAASGQTSFTGNTANMRGHGLDIIINAKNINGKFKWVTKILLSYATDKITNYKVQPSNIASYVSGSSFRENKPVSSIFSYRWAGLDPLTGDPQGILNKQISKAYASLVSSTDFNDLVYNGRALPPYFGSIRNNFSWRNLEISFNIVYKFGYYFRRTSIDYTGLFSGITDAAHIDYAQRWQKPGDELITNIPSLVYPANTSRDNFYKRSEILVEKGDHIRWQDIQLSYDLSKDFLRKISFQNIRLYMYISNLGILWRANKKDLDPDYAQTTSSIPSPKTIAIGARIDF